jgi:hypothetical protein
MQIVIMVVCTFIIAYVFNIGFFPAAIGGVVVGTVIWAFIQGGFSGGQQPTAMGQSQESKPKKE